jgi:hypothetical protein
MSSHFNTERIWYKPFAKVEIDGVYPNAIVAFRKRPFEQFVAKPDLLRRKSELLVARWEYIVILDLWWLKLRINWVGGLDAEVKELRARSADFSLGS